MTDVSALNARFGIKGKLAFREGKGGLIGIEVTTEHSTAVIALQGAQVVSWIPAGEKPVIWLSTGSKFAAGKSMRGGVPVCWPWFGAHATNPALSAHGYARTVPWDVVETKALPDGAVRLVFRLAESDATRAQWQFKTPVENHITIGKTLDVELVTRNSDDKPVTITEALHTYFAIGDIRKTTVTGLENCDYLDKVDAGSRKKQSGAIAFTMETDRIYVNTKAECVIEDTAWNRRIHIVKRGSQSTVVWNPWVEKSDKMGDMGENGYLRMLCVESANAAENKVTIAPGTEHRLYVSYRVSK